MIDQYKRQPIVLSDWPPPVGQDFYGKLALLQTQDQDVSSRTVRLKAQYMLRGRIDEIPKVTRDELINIQDVLKPCSSGQSLKVIIDGPPGIGKTTFCRKLSNMWANKELEHGQYDLVLYCSLRNDKIAKANELQELLKYIYQCDEIVGVSEWINRVHGEGLLLIFDGWDELSKDLRQSSLAARIIWRKMLAKCSIIVTSRTYASYSLLKSNSFSRHVEIMGFS